MIDVEQTALRAFEHQVLAGLLQPVDFAGDVADHRADLLGKAHLLVEDLLEVELRDLVVLREDEVVIVEHFAELRRETLAIEHVVDAQRAPRGLVFVGRADAAPGGPDGLRAARLLACLIERCMIRQDQRCRRAQHDAFTRRHAARFEHQDFFHQRGWRHDHAVADQATHAVAQDAGRDQVENGLVPADDDRVAGVVPALEAHDGAGPVGQHVHDLAFSFIAPLRADDYDGSAHVGPLWSPFTAVLCSRRSRRPPANCPRRY